jgi:hypothetical protein
MDKTKMDDSHPALKYFSTNVILPQVFFANMHVLAPLNFMLSPIKPKKKKKKKKITVHTRNTQWT